MVLIFDGSFQGFLNVLYHLSGVLPAPCEIHEIALARPELFPEDIYIKTEAQRSEKVWNKLRNHSPRLADNLFYAFHYVRPSSEYLPLIRCIHEAINPITSNSNSSFRNAELALESMAMKARLKARNMVQSLAWTEIHGVRTTVVSQLKVAEPVFLNVLNTSIYGRSYICIFPYLGRIVARNFRRNEHFVGVLPSIIARSAPEVHEQNVEGISDWLEQVEGLGEYLNVARFASSEAYRFSMAS